MKRADRKSSMKNQVTRTGKLVGGYFPAHVVAGIQTWIKKGDERDISTFIREAAREKLRRDGIKFQEQEPA